MELGALLEHLESQGSAQAARTYRRHGAVGRVLGVSYAELGKLEKRIKTDHRLALALWRSGGFEPRVLATCLADPAAITLAELEAWRGDLAGYPLVGAFAKLVARTPHAEACLHAWIDTRDEATSSAGWAVLSHLALANGRDDAFFVPFVHVIEVDLHAAPNRTRHAMNHALISIGLRSAALEKRALAAAARLGKVEVDHGDTDCKTPDAAAYLARAKKSVAARSAKAKKG